MIDRDRREPVPQRLEYIPAGPEVEGAFPFFGGGMRCRAVGVQGAEKIPVGTCEAAGYIPEDSVDGVREILVARRAVSIEECVGEQGLIVMEILDALYKSAKTGKPVQIKQKK